MLRGAKVATAGLLQLDYVEEGEELHRVGEEQVLVHDGSPVARLFIMQVEVHPLMEVPWEFAEAEGEGFSSIGEWREGHKRFWGQHSSPIDDEDSIVCVWFSLLARIA